MVHITGGKEPKRHQREEVMPLSADFKTLVPEEKGESFVKRLRDYIKGLSLGGEFRKNSKVQ